MSWELGAYNGVLYDDAIWFANNASNGLYRLCLKGEKIEFVDSFRGEDDKACLFKKIILYKDRLILLPALARNIHIYNLSSNTDDIIELEENKFVNSDYVCDAFIVGEELFIFPVNTEMELLVLNIKSKIIREEKSFKEQLNMIMGHGDNKITRINKDNHDSVHFCIINTNVVISWNVKTGEMKARHTSIDNLFAAFYYLDKYWLLPFDAKNLYAYTNDEKVEEYPISSYSIKIPYNKLIEWDDKLILLPAFCKEIRELKGTVLNKCWKTKEKGTAPLFFDALNVKDELWLLPFSYSNIVVFRKDGTYLEKNIVNMLTDESKDKRKTFLLREEMSKHLINENEIYTLKRYINGLK